MECPIRRWDNPLSSYVLTHRLFFDCVPSIKSTLATMPYNIDVKLYPVDKLMPSGQGPNTRSSAISIAIASNSTTASIAQSTLQPQGPSPAIGYPTLYLVHGHYPAKGFQENKGAADLSDNDPTGSHVPVATPSSNTDIPTSSTGISVGIVKSVQSLPTFSKSPGTTLQPSSAKERLNLPASNTEMVLTQGVSTGLPSPGIDAHVGLMSGTRTSTADYKSQYIFPSSHTLIPDSTATLGFDTHTSAQALPISFTQLLPDSSSTASLLFRPTATPSISNQPSPLTISGQTVTANSLGQYSIDNQTLTPGGVITVSGSKISLAPNASDLIIGTSTEALGPSVSAHLGSGPKGTEVQKFTGDALGMRDGLWSSSMMLLVSFLLLLWI